MLINLLKLFGTNLVETKFEPDILIYPEDYKEYLDDPAIKKCKYCGYDIDTNQEELCGKECHKQCWRYLGLIE